MEKADDARILGEVIDLPPMKASDRRVVHMTLQVFDDVRTESVGDDRDRHIRIIPTNQRKI
jgi:predicted RNA-binding protein Jag